MKASTRFQHPKAPQYIRDASLPNFINVKVKEENTSSVLTEGFTVIYSIRINWKQKLRNLGR